MLKTLWERWKAVYLFFGVTRTSLFHQFLPLAARISLSPHGLANLAHTSDCILHKWFHRDLGVKNVIVNFWVHVLQRLLVCQHRLVVSWIVPSALSVGISASWMQSISRFHYFQLENKVSIAKITLLTESLRWDDTFKSSSWELSPPEIRLR